MDVEQQRFISEGSKPNRAGVARWTEAVTEFGRTRLEPPSIPLNKLGSGYEPLETSTTGGRDVSPGHLSAPLHDGKSASTSTFSQHLDKNEGSHTPRRRSGPFVRFWWREILACALFLGSLLAMFATLYAYTNRPSPQWPNWLSLNTIIAIYVVLLKTGILLVTAEGLGQLKWSWFASKDRPLDDLVKYDDATRGPFGATVLLWRLRARHILSSFGALIIVLCLATDPFSQQIIRYYDCPVKVSGFLGAAQIPRTNSYAQQNAAHTGALLQNIDTQVQRSILAGVFSPVGPPDVECSTGNCTWPEEYSTLGWCSSCVEISDQIIITNKTLHGNQSFAGWNYTTSLPHGGLSIGMAPGAYLQNYAAMGLTPSEEAKATPNVISASIDFLLAKSMYDVVDPMTGVQRPHFVPIDPSTGLEFQGCNGTNDTWPCTGYGAARCNLHPCVKTFSATVKAGKVHETLVSTIQSWGTSESLFAATILDSACLTPGDRKELQASGYNITKNQRLQPFNMPGAYNSTKSDRPNMPLVDELQKRGCIYSIDATFMNSISGWLSGTFDGVASGPPIAPESPVGEFSGPQVVQSFFNFGHVTFDHVDAMFGNVTQSFTNYIRQNGDNFSTPANGTAYEMKTCVAVRWPFLAFPSALAFLTVTFFVLVLLETRPSQGRPHIWKSSPLALLYHGLIRSDGRANNTEPTRASHVEDVGVMKQMAKSTVVRLDRSFTGMTQLEVQSVGKR